MSTRKLIVAALLCGLAILLAFTVQLIQASNSRRPAPVPVTTTVVPS